MMERPPPSAVRARRDEAVARHDSAGEPLLPPDAVLEGEYLANDAAPLAARQATAAWTVRLLSFVFAVLEILIALRVLLKLIAANPESGFARFIYGATGPLIAPFKNLVASPTARNGAALEVSSLLAIVIYLLLNWLLARLLLLLIERPDGLGRRLRAQR